MTTTTHKASITLTSLAALLLAAGCSTPVPLENKGGAPVESRSGTAPGTGSAGAGQGTPQTAVTTVDLNKPAAISTPRIVYFDFDSFAIRDDGRPVIDAEAKQLVSTRGRRISIEGHTDERGGREYNLALGQKRAESVAKALTLLGVNEAQVEAVSFGKERPAAPGSDEAAWAKNRRAELKDK